MVRRSVDFPAPFGPSTAVIPRSGTERLTPSSAVTPPYATRSDSTASIGALRRGKPLAQVGVRDRLVALNGRRSTGGDEPAEVEDVDLLADGHDEVEPVLDQCDRHPGAQ